MPQVGGRRFENRDRWSDVACQLAIATAGTLIVIGVLELRPTVAFVWVFLAYTVYATIVTGALALALSLTRWLPGLRTTTVDAQSTQGVAALPWRWRYDLALDLGLAVVAFVLTGLAFAAGGELAVLILPVTAIGVWFLGNVVLAVAGRRLREAVWLTADHLVHDSKIGRARIERRAVVNVRVINQLVRVNFAARSESTLAPRPWRRRDHGPVRGRSVDINTELMGLDSQQLTGWLRTELDLDRPEPTEDVSHQIGAGLARWWRGR